MAEQLGDLFALSIPLVFFLIIGGLPAFAIYLDYKKKMAMIEKGLVSEDEKTKPENMLGWGIAILGIGISFVATRLFNLDIIATGGLILTSIGMALLISYKISKKIR